MPAHYAVSASNVRGRMIGVHHSCACTKRLTGTPALRFNKKRLILTLGPRLNKIAHY